MALALDGTAENDSGSASSLSVSLTTTSTNDIIVVIATVFNEAAHAFSSISDTASLTWTLRKNLDSPVNGVGCNTRYYYAVSTNALTNDSITVSYASATYLDVLAFGISGADTSTVFDSNASLPGTGTSLNTFAGPTVTYSTSNANDFIIGIWASDGVTTAVPTLDSGFTKIVSIADGGIACSIEYNIVSATQSSVTSNYNRGTNNNQILILDAIMQASAGTAYSKTITEKIVVKDPVTYVSQFVRSFTENIITRDPFTTTSAFVRLTSENIITRDPLTTSASYSRLATENIVVRDPTTTYSGFVRQVTESIVARETVVPPEVHGGGGTGPAAPVEARGSGDVVVVREKVLNPAVVTVIFGDFSQKREKMINP